MKKLDKEVITAENYLDYYQILLDRAVSYLNKEKDL